MKKPNLKKLVSFALFALSFSAVYIFGRHYYTDILNPKQIQFYFMGVVLYLLLMFFFNMMSPVYPRGLRRINSVKLKKSHYH